MTSSLPAGGLGGGAIISRNNCNPENEQVLEQSVFCKLTRENRKEIRFRRKVIYLIGRQLFVGLSLRVQIVCFLLFVVVVFSRGRKSNWEG